MILDILTVLFLVLGFALLFWMIGERRRDVQHYVTEPSRARATMPDSSGHVTSGQPAAADLRAQTSLTKLPRVARYTEGESEMSTAGLQELEEQGTLGVKLLATARELPPGPDRDNALQLCQSPGPGRDGWRIRAPRRRGASLPRGGAYRCPHRRPPRRPVHCAR